MTTPLTAKERDYIRTEFGVFFGRPRKLAEGIWLRKWRGGYRAGHPKMPKAAEGLVSRGLMEVRTDSRGFPHLYMTAAGIELLRATIAGSPRSFPEDRFRHLYEELGIRAAPGSGTDPAA